MPTLAANLEVMQGLTTHLFEQDFLLTWEHTEEELKAILTLADTFKQLHKQGKSIRAFDTGLAISIFRDNIHAHAVQLRQCGERPGAGSGGPR